MASTATPPWMTELLARNRKVLRTMRSTDSYFDGDGDKISSPTEENTNGLTNQVVDPLSPSQSSTAAAGATTIKSQGRMAALVEQQMHIKSRRSSASTEKSSPIREDSSRFMDDVAVKEKHHIFRSGEEESILEYGPGIVRKLRSRYQSLALRQYSSRPSLRRSASLENVLDTDSSGEGIKRESPSPTPFDENFKSHKSTTADSKVDNIMTQYGSSLVDQNNAGERKTPGPRGRTTLTERRDRMRRARSVDALHRTKHEEEILEKFKAVVLPKEEIVIIEVSKPRANLSGLGLSNNSNGYYLGTTSDKPYPTELFISPDRTATGLLLTTESQQAGNRTRSFISPEHELPPHDIVRETARIFEKNQENISINGNKKVGQALRLSKSYSSSGSSSTIAQSPPPPSPTQLQQQQRGTVMAQGSPSMQQLAEKGDKSPSTGPSFNTTVTAKSTNNTHTHGLKQVGIIRPTVNHPTSPLNLTNGEKVAKNNDTTRPAALSPILSPSQQPYKTFLQNSQKPPLSPKPIFTSSPRPTIIVNNNNQKTVPSVSATVGLSSTTKPSDLLVNQSLEKPTIIGRSKDNASPVNKNNKNVLNGSVNNRVRSPIFSPLEDHSLAKIVNGKAPKDSVSPVKFGNNTNESNEDSSSSVVSKGRESPTSIKRNQYSGSLINQGNSFKVHSPSNNNNETTPAALTKPKNSPIVNGANIDTSYSPDPKNYKTAIKKEEQALKGSNNNVKSAVSSIPASNKVEDPNKSSQLRVHQKQKSNQNGNASMVFNFTTRSSVPDYIEDDGLHKGRITLAGTVSDESVDDVDSPSDLKLLAKSIKFEGGNVIINGKSSIQKKPKSQKINISFNEDATTTYEYPSESSLLAEDETNEKDMLGHKGPSVMNTSGTGLGSYTPKQANSDYQLGNFIDPSINKKVDSMKTNKQNESELIEDYLKPDSETTNWSNELTADILF